MKRFLKVLAGYLVITGFILITGCGDKQKGENGTTGNDTLALPAMDSFRTTGKGLKYIIHVNKPGPSIKVGDVIRMDMLIRTKERHLMNTFVQEKDYYEEVKEPSFPGDIAELYPLLSEGDSVTTKILASKLYKGRVPMQIDYYDTVYTHIKVKGFFNEKKQLLSYIREKGHAVDTLEDGLYRTFFKQGYGNAIAEGDSVVIHLTGHLLDGSLFQQTDKNNPMAFTYGKKNLLEGLKKGLNSLKEGAEVKLFMTSDYGYGDAGARPHILPFSPLIYEINIIEVIEKPVSDEVS